MISYVQHKIGAESGQSVSKTILLDSDRRRIVGVFAIADPRAAEGVTIGLKYNGQEVLPRNFPLGLITYQGLMPLRDAMLPTAYEVPREDKNGVTVSVDIVSGSGAGGVPPVDLYFVTER